LREMQVPDTYLESLPKVLLIFSFNTKDWTSEVWPDSLIADNLSDVITNI
jgi:hypothetical protein